MAMELPASPKVYTTKYDNFKGVDFTNDATNVWRRRSPTGVNMLPDESGRPFKRHGWNILISNARLCAELGVESCQIQKCSYFELAGVDHIVVFTNKGVLFYDADGNFTAVSTDPDCYMGYDRSFFFEGNGMSAFYIYGNFKVWRYSYDNEDGFVFEDVTAEIVIPTVLIGTSANCYGTVYDGYNLLGTKARVEYNDINLFEYWCSEGLTVKVNDTFKTAHPQDPATPYYEWLFVKDEEDEEDEGAWTTVIGGLNIETEKTNGTIEVVGAPKNGDIIIIAFTYGVMLPNNVTNAQIDDVKAWASKKTQFDFPNKETGMNVTIEGGGGDAILHYDPTGQRAWIEFTSSISGEIVEIVSGEDFLRVEFPAKQVVITQYNDMVIQTAASLIGA